MTVFILENSSYKTRGIISRWMLEVKPGIFVGNPSKVVRDSLWKKIKEDNLSALNIHSNGSKEQGYEIEEFGEPKRRIVSFDGIDLIQYRFDESVIQTNLENV